MKVEILGTGCPKCKKTEKIVRKVVEELGQPIEVVKIQDIQEIVNRGVMLTPALFVDGQAKIVGRVPSPDEVKKLLQR
jgi:small redox-active disulfide protein 2